MSDSGREIPNPTVIASSSFTLQSLKLNISDRIIVAKVDHFREWVRPDGERLDPCPVILN